MGIKLYEINFWQTFFDFLIDDKSIAYDEKKIINYLKKY